MNIARARRRPANTPPPASGRRCGAAAALVVGLSLGLACGTGAIAGLPSTAWAAGADAPASTSPSSEDTSNDGRRARAAFERGLELSRQGRFTEARESFWAAYALRPHALASYNAALTCRALGDLPGALQAFDTTLSRPAAELTAAERQEIEKARAEVAQSLASKAPSQSDTPEESAAPAPPVVQKVHLWCDLPGVTVSAAGRALLVTRADATRYELDVPPEASQLMLTRDGYTSQTIERLEREPRCALKALPPAESPHTEARVPASKRKPSHSSEDPVDPGGAPSSVYWLTGAGAVLAVAGAGIWFYDNQRYSKWREDGGAASERDELRDSILFWDKIAATSGAAGAALLLAGGIVYWTHEPYANARAGSTWLLGPSSILFAHTW